MNNNNKKNMGDGKPWNALRSPKKEENKKQKEIQGQSAGDLAVWGVEKGMREIGWGRAAAETGRSPGECRIPDAKCSRLSFPKMVSAIKRDHSVALHHSLPPLSGSSILPGRPCSTQSLTSLLSYTTSNSLASSVGFYQATLSPLTRAANPARSRGGTWETDFSLFLSLSTLVRPKDVSHLATLRQTPALQLGSQIEE